jgi:hypothetical protein
MLKDKIMVGIYILRLEYKGFLFILTIEKKRTYTRV